MYSWLLRGPLAILTSVPLLGHGDPFLGATRCDPVLKECLKRTPGSEACATAFQKCLTSSGGVIERDNGSFSQKYHPDNPQFKKCQEQGLTSGTDAFDTCMNPGSKNRPKGTPPKSQTDEELAKQAAAQACKEELARVYAKCAEGASATTSGCDAKNDENMNAVSTSAKDLSQLVTQQASAQVQATCRRMAFLSQSATAAVTAFRKRCQNIQDTCANSCTSVITFIREKSKVCFPDMDITQVQEETARYTQATTANLRSCDTIRSKIDNANQVINHFAATMANATQCADQNFGGDAVSNAEFCKQNPNYPNCNPATMIDCSKAEFATTARVCICAKAPTDPKCSTAQKADTEINLNSGTVSASARLAGKTRGLASVDSESAGIAPLKNTNTNESDDAIDGRQGGVVSSSGSDGNNQNSQVAMNGENLQDPSENFTNQGSFYGGGGGRADQHSNTKTRVGGTAKAAANLEKFLPGGLRDPKKFKYGAEGEDGISGPHTDIWLKIQNRYRAVSPSLIP